MRKKVAWVSLFIILLANVTYAEREDLKDSDTVYSYYYGGKPKYNLQTKSEEPQIDKTRFVNWKTLGFYSQINKTIKPSSKTNFISQPFEVESELQDEFIQKIYADILKIRIDCDLNLGRLISLNSDLRKFILSRLYDPNLIFVAKQEISGLTLKCFLPFIGDSGLIDLVLKSQYFTDHKPLEEVSSKYAPNHYNKLVIDARGMNFSPSFFPKIYSYDENGNKILIYALEYSDWKEVKANGFVSFYTDEGTLTKDSKNFYISALETDETGYNLMISREDYLKFFASANSLHSLTKGNLIIITNNSVY